MSSHTDSLQKEISELEVLLTRKRQELTLLQRKEANSGSGINQHSSVPEKITLFRSLFRGREDLYALRFESQKNGKSGYQPACRNEWVQGICEKARVKCRSCPNRALIPVTDEVIDCHLRGQDESGKPFVVGIYPLLEDESCHFLALDFDKAEWKKDVRAFLTTCRDEEVPAYLERSRSGNGGHVWIFLEEALPAWQVRKIGAALMTKTLDRRPEVGLDSFDRFFPNQDTMPQGGFGNLIALPLQKKAREKGHSVFLDDEFLPWPDQWEFLSGVKKLPVEFVRDFANRAESQWEVLPVAVEADDSDSGKNKAPWFRVKSALPVIDVFLPDKVDVVLANQIFIQSEGLPPVLRNRILRLASFANPEFYKAQALRLPTWNKPRILYCYEQFPNHIGLPVGCLDNLLELLLHYNIEPILEDKRNRGVPLDVRFQGELQKEQEKAARALLSHEAGVLSATTAFGKTVLALWLIAQRKVNTLVLVHRKQLMEQWVQRAVQFLGLEKRGIGQFGGGKKKRNGLLDIAVIQSVSKQGEVADWISTYGQIIVDECHHISAFSFEQALRQSDALYKLGLSATVKRQDGRHPVVFMNLGKIRYSVSAKSQALKRDFFHRVIVRETEFRRDQVTCEKPPIQEVFRSVMGDEKRNRMIVQDVLEARKEIRQILILSERTEHLALLQDLLEKSGVMPFVLKGGLGKKQIKRIFEAIDAVPDSESRVILATGRYLGEGIDLPFLDTLFLTFPVSWRGTIAQYAGRLHRDFHGKREVRIYDYADLEVPVLRRMHEKRLRGYGALGYEVG